MKYSLTVLCNPALFRDGAATAENLTALRQALEALLPSGTAVEVYGTNNAECAISAQAVDQEAPLCPVVFGTVRVS